MTHTVWFEQPLTCPDCGRPSTRTGLHSEALADSPGNTYVHPGDVLLADASDFGDAYLENEIPLRDTFSAIEQWECSHCNTVQWARLEFERIDEQHTRFTRATPITLSLDAISSSNYISHFIDLWIKTNTGDEASAIDMRIAQLVAARVQRWP
ncbi:MAG: hypothetical protein KF773_09355 [Deltaproteobacteria bacterium]|nr:hypothetical protein [Deltaproteobacteria bacterium]